MHPNYEHYRKDTKGEASTPLSTRVPEEFKAVLELIASLEGDTPSGLLLEGAARVIEDRSTGQGLEQLQSTIEERRVREEQALDKLRRLKTELFGPQVD
ncbi:MAG: hypothetical protein ABIR37_01550 [Candidatus Saccharimonadales bacterium]